MSAVSTASPSRGARPSTRFGARWPPRTAVAVRAGAHLSTLDFRWLLAAVYHADIESRVMFLEAVELLGHADAIFLEELREAKDFMLGPGLGRAAYLALGPGPIAPVVALVTVFSFFIAFWIAPTYAALSLVVPPQRRAVASHAAILPAWSGSAHSITRSAAGQVTVVVEPA